MIKVFFRSPTTNICNCLKYFLHCTDMDIAIQLGLEKNNRFYVVCVGYWRRGGCKFLNSLVGHNIEVSAVGSTFRHFKHGLMTQWG